MSARLVQGCNAMQGYARSQDKIRYSRENRMQKRPQALIDRHRKCISLYIPTLGRYCTASAT
jgi:hypothetical protein